MPCPSHSAKFDIPQWQSPVCQALRRVRLVIFPPAPGLYLPTGWVTAHVWHPHAMRRSTRPLRLSPSVLIDHPCHTSVITDQFASRRLKLATIAPWREDNLWNSGVKINFRELRCEGSDWINLAEDIAPIAVSCVHLSDEPSVSVKSSEIFETVELLDLSRYRSLVRNHTNQRVKFLYSPSTDKVERNRHCPCVDKICSRMGKIVLFCFLWSGSWFVSGKPRKLLAVSLVVPASNRSSEKFLSAAYRRERAVLAPPRSVNTMTMFEPELLYSYFMFFLSP